MGLTLKQWTTGVSASRGWSSYWATQYKNLVIAEGGAIINETVLKSELDYIKSNALEDKIDYLISRNFGYKPGTEVNPKCIVAISFDDGLSPASENTVQYFIDKSLSIGTFFINAKFVGDEGHVTWETLNNLVLLGADIQCHSYSHAMMDVYGVLSDFTKISESECISELENSSSFFIANGLDAPVHFAYPRYITNDDRIKLVAAYRKMQRGYDEDIYMPPQRYYSIVWSLAPAYSIDFNNETSVNLAKTYVTNAAKSKSPVHISSHSTDETLFKDFLDHCISLGVETMGVSEYYNEIEAYRDKYYTVFANDYEKLKRLDGGTKLGNLDNFILFNDTYANIGEGIINRFKSNDYKVAFWDDTSDEALSCLFATNTKYHDLADVVVDESTDRIYLANHSLQGNSKVVFSGTEAPGGLTLGTTYYIRDRRNTPYFDFKICETYNGTAINITSNGVGVKLSTFGYRDVVKANYPNLNSFESIIKADFVSGAQFEFSVIGSGASGDLNDLGLEYFRQIGNKNSTTGGSINLSYNFFSGKFPESICNWSNITSVTAIYNYYITGGLANLAKLRFLNTVSLSFNAINEEIPTTFGDNEFLAGLFLDYNQITGVIPAEIGGCRGLVRLRLTSNQLSGYETGAISVAMTALVEVNLSINAIIDTAEINKILADCVLHEAANGTNVTLNLTGGTNAAPTGQGITDKNALNAAGWTVTTN